MQSYLLIKLAHRGRWWHFLSVQHLNQSWAKKNLSKGSGTTEQKESSKKVFCATQDSLWCIKSNSSLFWFMVTVDRSSTLEHGWWVILISPWHIPVSCNSCVMWSIGGGLVNWLSSHFYIDDFMMIVALNDWSRFELSPTCTLYSINNNLFIYLGFYVSFNTVQVISRRVVGRAEETST